jgi:hypothetical protein
VTRRAALVLLALACACPGLSRPIEAPQVSLGQASLEDAGFEAQLSVVNPNHERLQLEAIDWELAVDDRAVARGRSELRADIAAFAPTAVSLRGALTPGQRARLGDAASAATISGTLHLRAPQGLVAAAFHGDVER